jgi:hypothetical protein
VKSGRKKLGLPATWDAVESWCSAELNFAPPEKINDSKTKQKGISGLSG